MSQELEGTLTNSANLTGTFGSEGGGGTTNYNDLINKPSINSVTLQGNKTASQLGFAEVASSGDYDDLTNKPTIPAAQVNSDWNATSGVAEILNKPTLSVVATSGDYDDLTNKPTIPAAQVNSDWNSTSGVSEILNKPTIYQNAASLPISANDSTDTKSYIDTGLSGKQDKIKVDSETLTTNAQGFCSINLAGRRIIILSAWSSTGDVLIIPFSSSGADQRGAGLWWFRVHNDSMQVRANFNFDLYYAYIEPT